MKGNCGLQVLEALGETIRQAGKSPHRHPHGQILALHMACGNVIRIRPSVSNVGYHLRDPSWRVPFIAVLAVIAIEFDELCEVRLASEHVFNTEFVKMKSVRSELKPIVADSRFDSRKKSHCSFTRALANFKVGNQLALLIQRDKNPLIPKLGGVAFADLFLLLHTECPYFVGLKVIAFDSAHLFIKQAGASLPGQYEQPENRVSMNLGNALDAADAHTLDQQCQDHDCLVERQAHFVQGALVRFCERLAALRTAEALKAVTMLPETIAGNLARVARHCEISLSSQPTCRIMKLRVSLRLRLRWIQAPISVSAPIGALHLQAPSYMLAGSMSICLQDKS